MKGFLSKLNPESIQNETEVRVGERFTISKERITLVGSDATKGRQTQRLEGEKSFVSAPECDFLPEAAIAMSFTPEGELYVVSVSSAAAKVFVMNISSSAQTMLKPVAFKESVYVSDNEIIVLADEKNEKMAFLSQTNPVKDTFRLDDHSSNSELTERFKDRIEALTLHPEN